MSAERLRRSDLNSDQEGKVGRARAADPLLPLEPLAAHVVDEAFARPTDAPAPQSGVMLDEVGDVEFDEITWAQMDAYVGSMVAQVQDGRLELNLAGRKRLLELRTEHAEDLREIERGVAEAESVHAYARETIAKQRDIDWSNGIEKKDLLLMVRAVRYIRAFALRKMRVDLNDVGWHLGQWRQARRNLEDSIAAEAVRAHLEEELNAHRAMSGGADAFFDT